MSSREVAATADHHRTPVASNMTIHGKCRIESRQPGPSNIECDCPQLTQPMRGEASVIAKEAHRIPVTPHADTGCR